jgi:hypothetical protein
MPSFVFPNIQILNYFFAFEDSNIQFSQLTWMVLSQGFQDSPHLFQQALAKYFFSFFIS